MKVIKDTWQIILITLLITTSIFLFGFDNAFAETPETIYRVYLDGKSIGTIVSKEELEDYIDQQQEAIKEQYGVDKVYSPKGITIEKEVSYSAEILTAKEIYEKIANESSFTIDGFEVIINQEEKVISNGEEARPASSTHIYMTDKSFLDDAIETIAKIFVGEDEFIQFEEESQKEIEDTGVYINNIYIEEEITVENTNVPTDELIFTDSASLTKYLLYGTLEQQESYTVKEGDTIASVAFNNNLAPDEFLVANPVFTSVENILFPGQKVAIGLIKPKVSVVVELTNVEKQEIKYESEVKYDSALTIGTSYVSQSGQNGLNKVTQEVKYVNGKIETVIISNKEELIPVINKITIKGGSPLPGDNNGTWGWPTIKPYIISSTFGPRWGRFHYGIDICGTGHGSPIFAAQDGVVVATGYGSAAGNYVNVSHGGNYETRYYHLSKYYVSVGQTVKKGQVIAAMGNTGRSTGTHLHFEIRYNGTAYNPLSFY